MDRRKARILTERVLRRGPFVFTHLAFSSIRDVELERAEKWFLANFLLSGVSAIVNLYLGFRNLNLTQPLTLTIDRLILIGIGVVLGVSTFLAFAGYFAIGVRVVVERAVEIKRKD